MILAYPSHNPSNPLARCEKNFCWSKKLAHPSRAALSFCSGHGPFFQERNRNPLHWNGKKTIIETCFFHFFPMFSYRNMFFPYVFLCFFWSFLGSINRNATWLGSVWKNLVVPPQQISWPGRVAGWFHLKYAKFAEVYEVYSFQKFGNIQVYYFLDFQVGLCKVSSMLGFSYLNWRYLPHIRAYIRPM